jgi:transcriptional regulator with XRE-family HTH domain
MNGTRDPHNVALGQAMRRLRKEAKLGQEELAARAEVPMTTVSQIESGGIEADWGTLRRLAYALEVPLSEVFRLTEELEKTA